MIYISGQILLEKEFVEGYVGLQSGIISEIGEGKCPGIPLYSGIVIPSFINGHSHCADGRAPLELHSDLVEAVAPPKGLKHRYLNSASDAELRSSMMKFMQNSMRTGSSSFIDFREGGLPGVRLLRSLPEPPSRIILGRPLSPSYDSQEVDDILDNCDGLGLSCVSDMERTYMEELTEHVHRRGKILALHASENGREDIDLVLSLEPRFLVHMTDASNRDMRLCAEQDVPVVICPRSNFFFGKITPVKRMQQAGLETMLGTDNAMVCVPDMRAEGEFLLRLIKSQNGETTDVLDTSLLRIRKLLNAESSIPIKLGNKADMVVFPGEGKLPLADLFLRTNGALALIQGESILEGIEDVFQKNINPNRWKRVY